MDLKFVIVKGLRRIFNRPSLNQCSMDRTARAYEGASLTKVKVGRYSYIGEFCRVTDTEIGSFCSISSQCAIGGGAHPLQFVSTSPVFTQGHNPLGKHLTELPFDAHRHTVIGNDVWIGANAMVKSGVHIADGAVIGMGSVVTKDVGPYEIWAGNPARLIRKRFDDETIQKLLQSAWWQWPDEKISEAAAKFSDSAEMLRMIKEK